MPKKKEREISRTLNILNHYYIRSGLYRFMFRNAIKVILILAAVFFVFWFIEKYIIDLEYLFTTVLKSQKPGIIFILFFVSESILGLIPPDFFILWSKQFPHPYNAITILALLSYTGGYISYGIGKLLYKIPKINNFVENKIRENIRDLRRWGGLFIVVAALFPLPYSTISLAVGIVRYPRTTFLLLGLTRIARFYIYAFILFGIM
jgi:membrane protein YqaA with SNARE-associated domain